MPRIECNVEEFNWRPIEVFNKLAHSTLKAWRQSPWRWSPRRHDMKAFNGLGPFVIVLRVRIN